MTAHRLLEEPYSSSATKMHLQWSQRRRVPRPAPRPIVYSESGLRQKLLPVPRKTAPWRLGASLRPQPAFRAYDSHKLSWPRLEDRKSLLLSGQGEHSRCIHSQSCPGGVDGTLWRSCRGLVSGSCVTPAADCGVRRVLSRRRNSTQLGDQPKNGRGTSLSITAPTAQAVRSATRRGVHYPGFTEGPADRLLVQR